MAETDRGTGTVRRAKGSRPASGELEPTATGSTDKRRSRRRIRHRTAQLPAASRILYRIEHYSSMAGVTLAIAAALGALVAVGAAFRFRTGWVVGFEVITSSVTLLMVFVIQHTQAREQAATQRKLDELLRATPGAAESLMMLEEAPQEFMLQVEEDQRDTRSDSVGDELPGQ